MAKVQARSTALVAAYSVGNGNYYQQAQRVAEQLNWSFGYGLATQKVALVTARDGWGTSGQELQTHRIVFDTGAGYTRRYRFRDWIDPDAVSIALRTMCTFPAANTGRVRITIGAANAVLTHAAASTTTSNTTLATSATGTGVVNVELELDHPTGASGSCFLLYWGYRVEPMTAFLPDPTG